MPSTSPVPTPDKVTLTTEGDNRLNIPAALVRGALNAKPGGIIYVTGVTNAQDSSHLLIMTTPPADRSATRRMRTLTVTVRGNIRLGHKALRHIAPAGVAGNSTCTIGDKKLVIAL